MDVDALNEQQQKEYMQQRRCFKCGKVGHRAKECHGKAQEIQKVEGRVENTADEIIEGIAKMSEEDQEKVLTHFL